jgi:putative membrane protein
LPKKWASANTFEIQSSELAKDRAQSGDVKSFAEQMIKDHTKAGNDFNAVEEANISPPPPEEPDVKQNATLAKLKSAQGAAFDKAYVSAQLTAHNEAVSLFRNHAKSGRTTPLKQFAQSTLPTLEHHLSMVQELSRPSGVASKQAPKGPVAPRSARRRRRPRKPTSHSAKNRRSGRSPRGLLAVVTPPRRYR